MLNQVERVRLKCCFCNSWPLLIHLHEKQDKLLSQSYEKRLLYCFCVHVQRRTESYLKWRWAEMKLWPLWSCTNKPAQHSRPSALCKESYKPWIRAGWVNAHTNSSLPLCFSAAGHTKPRLLTRPPPSGCAALVSSLSRSKVSDKKWPEHENVCGGDSGKNNMGRNCHTVRFQFCHNRHLTFLSRSGMLSIQE